MSYLLLDFQHGSWHMGSDWQLLEEQIVELKECDRLKRLRKLKLAQEFKI